MALQDALGRIKAVALDVDGVLTDGMVTWSTDGTEGKTFSFLDIMGISLGHRAGLVFALISGEDSPLVDRFASKMGIAQVWKGCKDKATALRAFAEKQGLALGEVCFVGDDVNDLPALRLAGLAAAPASAHTDVMREVHLVTASPGGHGAVREIVDQLLSARRPGQAAG